ncbi:MAG: hypothetical protein KAJ91_05035 [Candidatus Aenigmarchaeota archaeon]|nr:hypothetical protein [Candidatus Aenigmarchaeota archaeon]
MEETKKFEIVVKDGHDALRLVLPDNVVDRIKKLSPHDHGDFKELNNDDIMKVMVKSLDILLYGFEHSPLHTETTVCSECGPVTTEKSSHGEKKTGNP